MESLSSIWEAIVDVGFAISQVWYEIKNYLKWNVRYKLYDAKDWVKYKFVKRPPSTLTNKELWAKVAPDDRHPSSSFQHVSPNVVKGPLDRYGTVFSSQNLCDRLNARDKERRKAKGI